MVINSKFFHLRPLLLAVALHIGFAVVFSPAAVLAANDNPSQNVVPSPKATAVCPHTKCLKRPTVFEFQFIGTECRDSTNLQNGKFKCNFEAKTIAKCEASRLVNRNPLSSETPIFTSTSLISKESRVGAHIRFIGKNDITYFDTWVQIGKTFRLNNQGSKFPSDMYVDIFSGSDREFMLQSTQFHTSCSKDLFLGDVFGAVKLVGLYYKDGVDSSCNFVTNEPTMNPSFAPTSSPTHVPSLSTSQEPSSIPTSRPSYVPSSEPTPNPPSPKPSTMPSIRTSENPSRVPTSTPSSTPSISTSGEPSRVPTSTPSSIPSSTPSSTPSGRPSTVPTSTPSTIPSINTSSGEPSGVPTSKPSATPSGQPSRVPSTIPSISASGQPSNTPSSKPSTIPSISASGQPSTLSIIVDPPEPDNVNPTEPDKCPPSLCQESPIVMTFAFLPDNGKCSASSNSQDTDKFVCDDYNIDNIDIQNENTAVKSNQYYVVMYKARKDKKKKYNRKKGKSESDVDKNYITTAAVTDLPNVMDSIVDDEVYFSDYVTSGEELDIRAADSKKMKIPSNMSARVYEVKEAGSTLQLRQAFTFHSSCSSNLFVTDTFGSIKLVGLEYDNGNVVNCPPP